MLCLVKVLRNAIKKNVRNELNLAGSPCVASLDTNSCDFIAISACIYTFRALVEVLQVGSKFHSVTALPAAIQGALNSKV